MLGKLAGAWLGSRIVGRNSGMKGAALGYGATALARRGLGPLALGAGAIWGFNKLRERRRCGLPVGGYAFVTGSLSRVLEIRLDLSVEL